MTPEEHDRIREAARRIAADAPPLTDEQKARLRVLLRPARTEASAA